VRILLDENLPRQLRHHLPGHHVRTVRQQRWTGVKNGELLRRAALAGFDVLVTADRNLQFQQNVVQSLIAVIVIVVRRIKLEDVLPHLPGVLKAIDEVRPGEVRRVGTP
jgi:hypothetical protein